MVVLLAGALAGAVTGWQRSARMKAENSELKDQIARVQSAADAKFNQALQQHQEALKRLQDDAREVHKLRSEVRQLGKDASDAASLRAENNRLRTLNTRSKTARASASAAAPELSPEEEAVPIKSFPKENWDFSGYATPDDALVSAIWAMQQGDPQTYLDSLGPNEQVRMAERWKDQSEQEIAAKHQGDVARITGLDILGRETVSRDEIQMDVRINGTDRLEKVSMKRVEGQWRFDGYIQQDGK